jgi:hypothetical protein
MELYLTVVPYRVNAEQAEGVVQQEDVRYNWLEQYVSQQNEAGNTHVFFDYTIRHLHDIGIDFESGTDTLDLSHLNFYGSIKYSWYLGSHLRYLYGEESLPDHRGDPYYSSWDVHVEEIRKTAEENGYEWR